MQGCCGYMGVIYINDGRSCLYIGDGKVTIMKWKKDYVVAKKNINRKM